MDTEPTSLLEEQGRSHDRVEVARRTTIDGRALHVQAVSHDQSVKLRLTVYDDGDKSGTLHGEFPRGDIDQVREAIGKLLAWTAKALAADQPNARAAKVREVYP